MDEGIDSDFFPDEEPLIGEIMLALSLGSFEPLVAFMTRGKPISPRASFFIGSLIRDGVGDFSFEYSKRKRRGAPIRHGAQIRVWRAALLAHWLIKRGDCARRPPKREEAVNKVSIRFHCDIKRVRTALGKLEKWKIAPVPWRAVMRQLIDGALPSVLDAEPMLARIAQIIDKYQRAGVIRREMNPIKGLDTTPKP